MSESESLLHTDSSSIYTHKKLIGTVFIIFIITSIIPAIVFAIRKQSKSALFAGLLPLSSLIGTLGIASSSIMIGFDPDPTILIGVWIMTYVIFAFMIWNAIIKKYTNGVFNLDQKKDDKAN